MFHCESPDFVKTRCLNSLTNTDKRTPRVIIATSTIGCGINVKPLQYVCHFGPAHSLVDYRQQIGRAGRSGEPNCHAILYTYKTPNKNVNQKMKDYATLKSGCLRTSLFSPFSESNYVPSLDIGHNYCSFCTISCSCDQDHQSLFNFERETNFFQNPPYEKCLSKIEKVLNLCY